MKNPFTPTFGIVPPYLAGRDVILNDMNKAFDNWPGDPNLSTILIGPRGSGKTALLSCIGDVALEKGWIVADTSASEDMMEDILQRAIDKASEFISGESGRHLTGIDIGSVLGLSWTVDSNHQPNWRSQMSELLTKLGARDVGLLITIDEVRGDIDAMVKFASIYQLLRREGTKLALVMAGLPSQVSDLIGNKSDSFLRRSRQQYLGRISDTDIRSAFRKTIESAGKCIEPKALDNAVQASDGFAYMMQLVGFQMWDVSGDKQVISEEDAVQGISLAKQDFQSGVLNNTYRELSKGDIDFLKAMLPDTESSKVSDIAKRLGKSSGYASTYKKRLLQAGIIEETHRSQISFAMPLFRDYLQEQADIY